jgi:hypothetical protein
MRRLSTSQIPNLQETTIHPSSVIMISSLISGNKTDLPMSFHLNNATEKQQNPIKLQDLAPVKTKMPNLNFFAYYI